MSIRRYETGKGPRWQVEWRVGPNLKRRKSFQTEREAREFEALRRLDRSKGSTYDPRAGARVTVAAAYERWLASRPDVAPHTRACWEASWRSSVAPAFGAWSLTEVSQADVQAWVNALSVGPRTQRAHHTVLKHVMTYAVRQGWIVASPCAETAFPPLRTRQPDFLSVTEVEELADLCTPYGELVRLMAYTGLRIGEALSLRVKDWHPDDGRLLVQRGKTASARRPVFVPELLRNGLTEQAAGRAGDDSLFRAPRGGKLSRGQFVKQVNWNTQRDKLGRPTLTPHALRHTYASLSRSLTGSDLRKLQAQLGHASASTTLSVYTHLFGDELAEQASLLNGAIKKQRGK